jgi:hypothetical protein
MKSWTEGYEDTRILAIANAEVRDDLILTLGTESFRDAPNPTHYALHLI